MFSRSSPNRRAPRSRQNNILCLAAGCLPGKSGQSPGFQTVCLVSVRIKIFNRKKPQTMHTLLLFHELRPEHRTFFPPPCHRSHSCALNSPRNRKGRLTGCFTVAPVSPRRALQHTDPFVDRAPHQHLALLQLLLARHSKANVRVARKMLMKHK